MRDLFLLWRGCKYLGPVLHALVRALTVQLRGIVRNGEIDTQDLAIRHLPWIESDLHRFRVARIATADGLVLRRTLRTAGVTRKHFRHTLHMLEHALHAPEAAARQDGGFARGAGANVDGRRRQHARGLVRLCRRKPYCVTKRQGQQAERQATDRKKSCRVHTYLQIRRCSCRAERISERQNSCSSAGPWALARHRKRDPDAHHSVHKKSQCAPSSES